ncbi:Calx-beta domain-containing protein [Synechocystis sp. LKSZ1]|uniref:beta strand repeat-containing protein n=1 Tax=Synechocystis sp. LKSZ1 TaxID=3144951 RepID=UPI00336BF893
MAITTTPITRITNNNIADIDPIVSGNNTAWYSVDGTTLTIYFNNGSSTTQVAQYQFPAETAQNQVATLLALSGGNLVWSVKDGATSKIFLYNGSTTTQLSDSNIDSALPAISGNNVVWTGVNGNDSDIYLYNGSTVTQLTNNNFSDVLAHISGNKVVWMGLSDPNDINTSEIFLYDGTQIIQLTNNSYADSFPYISGNNVVWLGKKTGENDTEVFLYNGSTTVQLTDNDLTEAFSSTFATTTNNNPLNYSPISGNNIVWIASNNNPGQTTDPEVYFYNGSTTTQLTNNSGNELFVDISGSNVIWSSFVDGDDQLFLYNGTTTTQLTNGVKDSVARRFVPRISGNKVVWFGTTNSTLDSKLEIYSLQFQDNTSTLPTVTLAVNPSNVLEDGTANLVYTFTRTGNLSNSLTVNYTIGGTATNGTDYATIPTNVTFAANASTAQVLIDPIADSTSESNETVSLQLSSVTIGYIAGTTGAVIGTIQDDDTLATPTEGNDTIQGTAQADLINGLGGNDLIQGGLGNDTLIGGTGDDDLFGGDGDDQLFGNEGNDYLDGGNGNDTLEGGDGDDYLYDAGYGLGNTLLRGGNGVDQLIGGDGNDTLEGGADSDILLGGAGNDRFRFFLGSGLDTVGKVDNLFIVGQDLLEIDIAYGFSSSTQLLNAITNSGQIQPGIFFSLIDLGNNNQITVFSNQPLQASNFAIIDSSGNPNNLPDLVPYQPIDWDDRIVLSTTTGTSTSASQILTPDTLYIDWAVLNQGSQATANSFSTRLFLDGVAINTWSTSPPLDVNFYTSVTDYQIGPLSAGSHTLILEADYLNQEPESNNANNSFTKTFTVLAPLPTITLAVSPSSVTEDGTPNLVYTFTRTGDLTNSLTVNYSLGGTATNGNDYANLGTNVIFQPGSATATVTVNPTPDSTVEPDETISLTLVAGTGYSIGTTNAVIGTIQNDDAVALPTITLAVSPSSVTEDGTPNLVYTFTRTGDLTNSLTVNYSISGTATNGNDYANLGTNVIFQPGSAAATVTVNPTPDSTVEPDETVSLTLAAGTGYTIGTTTAVTGTIQNDDAVALPTITLAVSLSSVTEDGTGNLTYTFTRSGDLTNSLTVNYTIGGTATNGNDYANIGSSVTFISGSAAATVTIDPTPDSTIEPDETVTLTLAPGNGYSVGTSQAITSTIQNDDSPIINVSISSNSVLEDKGISLFYTFTRTGSTTNPLTVTYTIAGTATNGLDYATLPGSITFAANTSITTLALAPIADSIIEPDETVSLTLATGTGYTIGTTTAVTGTIQNDDFVIPNLSIQDAATREGNSGTKNLTFNVTLSQASAQTVTVSYSTATPADHTATPSDIATPNNPADYTATNGTLTIPAGQLIGQINVPIMGDTRNEDSETFLFKLSNPVGAVLSNNQAVGTIEQDDTPTNPLVLTGGTVQIAYVAYYGRPGDPGGLAFWNQVFGSQQVVFGSPEFETLANAFGNPAPGSEADRLYGALSNREKVRKVYDLAFNRDPEQGGWDFWTGLLDRNQVTPVNFALAVALGASNGTQPGDNQDLKVIRNKIASADLISQAIDTPLERQATSGPSNEIFGRNWLAPFGDTSASLYAAETALANFVTNRG